MHKNFRARLGTTMATIALVIGCTGRSVNEEVSLWDQAKDFVSDAAVQALIDIKGPGQILGGTTEFLNKFADNNLKWITDELIATTRAAKEQGLVIDPPVGLTAAQQAEVAAIMAETEAKFINKFGWMNLDPNGPDAGYGNENPTYFMAQYLWLLKRLGFLTDEYKAKMLPKFIAQIKEMELQPGLYDRFAKPRAVEINPFSHDENQGLAHIDSLFNFQIGVAKAQYLYGKKYNYVYMNTAWSAPDKFNKPIIRGGQVIPKAKEITIAQRYGGQIEVIKRTGGVAPSTASDLLLCADLFTALRDPCVETSVPMLNYMRTTFLQGQSEILDGCIIKFRAKAKTHFAVGNVCYKGRAVTCPNAYCAMTDIYYDLPDGHPINKLAHLLPAGG